MFLDQISIRDLLSKRLHSSSEPLIVFNNVLRWALFQLDKTILEEMDDAKGADIPVAERSKMINKVRQEKIKDYTFSDISKYLDMVLDLVPWAEFSQHDFIQSVASADVLPKVSSQDHVKSFLISCLPGNAAIRLYLGDGGSCC